MSAKVTLIQLRAELTCPLCGELFDDPQQFSGCGHAFCSGCVLGTLEGPGINKSQCPICGEPAWKKDLRFNVLYQSLVNALRPLLREAGLEEHDTVRSLSSGQGELPQTDQVLSISKASKRKSVESAKPGPQLLPSVGRKRRKSEPAVGAVRPHSSGNAPCVPDKAMRHMRQPTLAVSTSPGPDVQPKDLPALQEGAMRSLKGSRGEPPPRHSAKSPPRSSMRVKPHATPKQALHRGTAGRRTCTATASSTSGSARFSPALPDLAKYGVSPPLPKLGKNALSSPALPKLGDDRLLSPAMPELDIGQVGRAPVSPSAPQASASVVIADSQPDEVPPGGGLTFARTPCSRPPKPRPDNPSAGDAPLQNRISPPPMQKPSIMTVHLNCTSKTSVASPGRDTYHVSPGAELSPATARLARRKDGGLHRSLCRRGKLDLERHAHRGVPSWGRVRHDTYRLMRYLQIRLGGLPGRHPTPG
eukprot:jgi/Botrbrau1/16479/Bobra.0142s0073.1